MRLIAAAISSALGVSLLPSAKRPINGAIETSWCSSIMLPRYSLALVRLVKKGRKFLWDVLVSARLKGPEA